LTNDENTQRGSRIYAQLLIIEGTQPAVNSSLCGAICLRIEGSMQDGHASDVWQALQTSMVQWNSASPVDCAVTAWRPILHCLRGQGCPSAGLPRLAWRRHMSARPASTPPSKTLLRTRKATWLRLVLPPLPVMIGANYADRLCNAQNDDCSAGLGDETGHRSSMGGNTL
jgi:hypothetical protein